MNLKITHFYRNPTVSFKFLLKRCHFPPWFHHPTISLPSSWRWAWFDHRNPSVYDRNDDDPGTPVAPWTSCTVSPCGRGAPCTSCSRYDAAWARSPKNDQKTNKITGLLTGKEPDITSSRGKWQSITTKQSRFFGENRTKSCGTLVISINRRAV